MITLTPEQQSLISHPLAATVAKGMLDQEKEGWATLRDLSGRKPFGTIERFICMELVKNKILASSAKGTWWRFTAHSNAWATAVLAQKETPLTTNEQAQ